MRRFFFLKNYSNPINPLQQEIKSDLLVFGRVHMHITIIIVA
jgi:hypothetical protein